MKKGLKILQIQWLSGNSSTLDYAFWLKAGQTFVILFIGRNRVIVCLESSFVRYDVYFFVQDSPILFYWSVAALFQYAFVDTFSDEFKFF